MRIALIVLAGALSLVSPAIARADWVVSPFVGGNAGGDATGTNTAVGVSGGWTGRWIGGEADLAWAPQFFEQNGFTIDRRVTTVMGNAVVPIPAGRREMFQPYVSGGLGVIRLSLAEAGGIFALTDRNTFGGNVGGGASLFFNRSVGVRGDVRYFHGLSRDASDANDFGIDLSAFHFWRTSVGLAVRF